MGGNSGSSGSSYSNNPDTLRSDDTFETLIALGEGPWKGLQNGNQSFLIGDTQLTDDSGNANFPGFTLNFFEGDAVPSYTIALSLSGASCSTNIGTNLWYNQPITRSTVSGDIVAIGNRIVLQSLITTDSSGSYATTLTLQILFKPTKSTTWVDINQVAAVIASIESQAVLSTALRANAAVNSYLDVTQPYLYSSDSVSSLWDNAAIALTVQDTIISGKTQSDYVYQTVTEVLPLDDTWDIQVVKLTANSDGATHYSDTMWESFQALNSQYWKFPNTACVQIYGTSSTQFSSLPQLSGIYDMLVIKVPANYDPINRTYTGIWDGTFQLAWTNNPAWCLYDLMTNTRYGASFYRPLTVDKWSFYEAAQWCDETVGDGLPRYTFNALISDARSVKEQAKYMAGAFNGVMFTDLNGTIYLKVDKDEQAVALFTRENVIGDISYSFTDITSQYNYINCTFTNPEIQWNTDKRLITDPNYIAANGQIRLDFVAVGCTNASEAIRRARYKLITATTETMTATLVTNRLGANVKPMDVILIGDEDLGFGVTGRIKSYAGNTITLRDPIYLEAGQSYTLVIDVPSGVVYSPLAPTAPGSTLTLTMLQEIPPFVPPQAVFSLYNSTLQRGQIASISGTALTLAAPTGTQVQWGEAAAAGADAAIGTPPADIQVTFSQQVAGNTPLTVPATHFSGETLTLVSAAPSWVYESGVSATVFTTAPTVTPGVYTRTTVISSVCAPSYDTRISLALYEGHFSSGALYITQETVNLGVEPPTPVAGSYHAVIETSSGVVDIPIQSLSSDGSMVLAQAPPSNVGVGSSLTIFDTNGPYTVAKPFRVLKITETDGTPDHFEINCIEINRNKWYEADQAVIIPQPNYSTPTDPLTIPAPVSVTISQIPGFLVFDTVWDTTGYRFYSGEWQVWWRLLPCGTTTPYQQWNRYNGNLVVAPVAGTYQFVILPVNVLGQTPPISSMPTYNFTVA